MAAHRRPWSVWTGAVGNVSHQAFEHGSDISRTKYLALTELALAQWRVTEKIKGPVEGEGRVGTLRPGEMIKAWEGHADYSPLSATGLRGPGTGLVRQIKEGVSLFSAHQER